MPSYADLDAAKVQLDLSDDEPDDAADIALLVGIASEVSRTLELKTGRSWGGTATPTARTIDGVIGRYTDILLLPEAVRSITGVAIVGYNPATLTQSVAYGDNGQWIPWNTTANGDILALRRVDGLRWPAGNGIDRVTVTGVWSDATTGQAVPQEIVDAATFVTVETFRQRKSSPSGEIGPDGMTIRPRNPWGFETVKEAIKHNSALPAVVF